MNKIFSEIAWVEYSSWKTEDKKIFRRINELIKDINENGNKGIGKPEQLSHELTGYWSRRITSVHRLIYSIDDENINIVSCKNNY